MRLAGLLVDLVPWDQRFDRLDHQWQNGPSTFWSSMGERRIVSRARLEAWQATRTERREQQAVPPVQFGIQTKAGVPIGTFVVRDLEAHDRRGMLGARLGEPDYWGGGYGTDALLLVADYAFDWLDLRKLWLITMGLNARVIRQMEKVGFTLEVRQRAATWVDGAWVDALFYGLLRDEWPGRAALIEKLGLRAHTEE